jgi:predicted transposase YdaD
VPPDRVATLWIATYTLMGLVYPKDVADRLLAGVRGMKESVTYQAILAEGREEGREEGRLEEAREMVLLAGAGRLGAPGAEARAAVARIASRERLHALVGRIQSVESWDELLAD